MRDNDYNETFSFLFEFFQYTDDALEKVEFRAIANDGSGPRGRMHVRDFDQLLPFLRRHDALGVAVYFGCCTRIAGAHQGRREHLASAVGLWVDIDCYKLGISIEDAVRALRQCPMRPTVTVCSGGGVHAYWLFREPLPLPMPEAGEADEIKERLDMALGQLAGIFCGDPVPSQIAAVMRLPGTHNSKSGEMVPCVVLEASWTRYELDDLEEMLFQCRPLIEAPVPFNQPNKRDQNIEADPFTVFARQYAFKPPIDVEEALRLMAYGDVEHGIHRTQLRVSASLANTPGVSDDDIVEILMTHTERAAPPGARWNWAREEREIRKMIGPMRERRRAEGKDPYPQAPQAPTGGADPPKVVQLRPREQAPPEAEERPKVPAVAGPSNYPLNDLGNAMRLLEAHRAVMRYVLGIGWHIWDRRRFRRDPESGRARKLAHDVVSDMLNRAFNARGEDAKAREKIIKFAIQCANSGRLANMLHEAEPYQSVEADDLDKDPWLLNCLNGTVDLRTGAIRPHDQADLMTKLCRASYRADAACPQWEKFVEEIFGGDTDLVGFVQRSLGYSLTGSTREQVLFIMHGSGSNGKTVLIETIQTVLGDYVKRSPADTWASKPAGAPTNDIAALVGARLVSVVETEQDRHLAEALVKQATGGDTMTARFHHKEFFSFIPLFKLWFATNHRPKIKGSDYAIWRRIYLLPFTVKFVDADKVEGSQKVKDPDLMNKLKAEHDGILAWMVRGCLEWQRIGLKPPEAVRQATEAYQDSQDNVAGFVRDGSHQSKGLRETTKRLYAAYEIWCEEMGEEAVSKMVFAGKLDELGFLPGKRTTRERIRQGIELTLEYSDKVAQKAADEKAGRD
jgi:P4 family phage/plasmid primase-like protien